jgi:hypothetical protein
VTIDTGNQIEQDMCSLKNEMETDDKRY